MLPKIQFLNSAFLPIHFQNPEVVMPRIPRLLVSELPTVYHVISRTALPGLPFDGSDKDRLQWLIHHFSRIYFTEILGFCLMDNHFHLLVRMFPENHADEFSLRERFKLAHGAKAVFSPQKIPDLRLKWSSLSEFVKEIKQSFSRYYNKRMGAEGICGARGLRVSSFRTAGPWSIVWRISISILCGRTLLNGPRTIAGRHWGTICRPAIEAIF
jgi:REP element-mobilizing transposase RayT